MCCGGGSTCGRRLSDAQVAAALYGAVMANLNTPRGQARARFEASWMAAGRRETRTALAALRAEHECMIGWTAQDDRDIADLLACRVDLDGGQ